jgi:hypothetical protein
VAFARTGALSSHASLELLIHDTKFHNWTCVEVQRSASGQVQKKVCIFWSIENRLGWQAAAI